MRGHLLRIRAARALGALALVSTLGSPIRAQDGYQADREAMVELQIRGRGIRQSDLLEAMSTVPRHLFVPQKAWPGAYRDEPLPSGDGGGAILQPYVSALMIELLHLDGSQRVLEIGTGTGYDAAVLSRLAKRVYTIEISERLGKAARGRLKKLGFDNVEVKVGDGNAGWPSEAPFDAILLTAAPEDVPPMLLEQLTMNGRMVVAVGGFLQNLTVVEKTPLGFQRTRVEPVRIGPMRALPK